MPDTIPQPPGGGSLAAQLEWLQRELNFQTSMADSLAWALEQRVMDLEEVTAARWPRRLVLAWRLGRRIRRAVAPYRWAGPEFAGARMEQTAEDWRMSSPVISSPPPAMDPR